jgi:hypothetical protein
MVVMIPLIVGLLYLLGIWVGIALLFIWWRIVRNPALSFEGKKNFRATVLLAIPGVLCLGFGIYYRLNDPLKKSQESYFPSHVPSTAPDLSSDEPSIPTLAYLHVVNKSEKDGNVEVGDETVEVPSGSSRQITFSSYENRDTVRAWLGNRKVFQEVIDQGTYIGNLSRDVIVVGEEIRYAMWKDIPWEDLKMEILNGPGLKKLTPELVDVLDIYGFHEEPPKEIELRRGQNETYIVKYDLAYFTKDEFEEWKQLRSQIKE